MPMPALSDEPALGFWLRYAEREGALVERRGDAALLLLPQPLQETSGLPEEVTVTADPDVAREDRAELLIAGHPTLDRAAAAVLAEGDAGHAFLPWPASRPPARSMLEARARELVGIEHGRIDAAGEPSPAYAPLLRVGAMITYMASLRLRFQELEEAWVDARSGLELGLRLQATLRNTARLPRPDSRQPALEAELSLALPAAHEQLEQRATTRQASLGAHARRALGLELARADSYYQAALDSIRRRRSTAAAERVRLLDTQADATRAEHARRRREIEEEFRARHEIRPVRLHLVYVPAFRLAVDVRRGSRVFPFALTWVPGAEEFARVRCPACGATEPLVAARDRLGCRSCTSSVIAPRPVADRPAPEAHPARKPPAADRPATRHDPRVRHDADARGGRSTDAGTGTPVRQRGGEGAGGAARVRANDTDATKRRPRPNLSAPAAHDASQRTGNKLALDFWQRLARGDRWPRKKVVRDSPLRALHRLYGPAGPLYALGIPIGQWPDKVTAGTHPTEGSAPTMTIGVVGAGAVDYHYSLCWWLEADRPVIGEIAPTPHPLALPPARGETRATAARLHEHAPQPTADLDPVAAALWRAELGRTGLPFVVRCLAIWWRLESSSDPAKPAAAVAAAIAGAVARAAGFRRSKAETAAIYETDLGGVDRVARTLGSALRLSRVRGW